MNPRVKKSTQEPSPIELWGGVECTVNRVQDHYIDQLLKSGHCDRLSDLGLFRGLGITSLRHAILWERVAPRGLCHADWTWADASLERIQQLAIRPIVGLIHHGSGPSSTSLMDKDFPERLADYAGAVATRYPWVEHYTPVNEPLTTARFSGLYGHWYPHRRDDLSFSRALLNQCRAVVLAMRAIRLVNSSAKLVQTEDVGKVFSTPRMSYQARFENERRWATYDLLLGHVNRHHPLWSYFQWAGVNTAELEWFLDNPSPPDILGLNHYLSGERYLDEHLDGYPEYTHGGNGRDRYADVLAARVLQDTPFGPALLLRETWDRYQRPIAVTECHNGCTREEQLRWFLEVWRSVEGERDRGANIIAVTAWSLLGAFDWGNLVTRDEGCYEPGVFDIRSRAPRPTALTHLLRSLSSGQGAPHPVLDGEGWWKRPTRFIYGFSVSASGSSRPIERYRRSPLLPFVRPVLITGGPGTLGKAFARICDTRGIAYLSLSRQQLDIADPSMVEQILSRFRPWAVINAAGYARVDDAESDRERCNRDNTAGPQVLAAQCAQRGIQLLTFSSDLVFDGEKQKPYVESDRPNPLNHYGVTKVGSEHQVLSALPSALIVRTSAFFGPWDEYNFVTRAIRTFSAHSEFVAAEDVVVSPTYVPDLVNHSLDLLIDGEKGLWHLTNGGQINWAELAEKAAALFKIPSSTLDRRPFHELCLPARRPLYSALTSERGSLMPDLDDALRRFCTEYSTHAERAIAA